MDSDSGFMNVRWIVADTNERLHGDSCDCGLCVAYQIAYRGIIIDPGLYFSEQDRQFRAHGLGVKLEEDKESS